MASMGLFYLRPDSPLLSLLSRIMRKTTTLLLPVLLVLFGAGAPAQNTDADPNGTSLHAVSTGGGARSLGDLIAGPWDVETGPNDNRCLGVEEMDGFLWVTGGGHSTIGWNYMVHQYDMDGVFIQSFPQTSNTTAWGGRDMVSIGNTLYIGSDNAEVSEYIWNGVTLTHVALYTVPVTGTVRALTQRPSDGHFFTKSFTGSIYEFDLTTAFNTFTNTGVSAYGFGWDYVGNTIWSTDASASATELDPADGQATGRGFSTALGGSQGGADVYDDPRNLNGPSMVMLHQTTPDQIAIYDTTGTPPPPPPTAWTVNLPTAFVPADGFMDDFEGHGGVVPPHMAVTAIDPLTGLPDPEAWCDIAGGSGLGAASGTACLEMGLDPLSSNYHNVRNALVVGLDGSAAANFDLSFNGINHGEESHAIDGVWVSADGLDWWAVRAGWSGITSTWGPVSGLDLSSTPAVVTGTFYLMFAQEDNFPYGYLDGAGVDDILVGTPPPPGPVLTVNNIVGGQVGTVEVTGATPGGMVIMGTSFAGGGPTSTIYGTVMLSPPIHTRSVVADGAGMATTSRKVYAHLSGKTLYFQAVDDTTGNLTNALSVVVG